MHNVESKGFGMSIPTLQLHGSPPKLNPEDAALLTLLMQSTLGTRVRVTNYHILNYHEDYVVLRAELNTSKTGLLVKLAGPQASLPCPFEQTASLHKLVSRQTDLPLPQALAANISYDIFPWRYIITSYIPGVEWSAVRSQMGSRELRDAFWQIGEAIGKLHSIHFPRFGYPFAEVAGANKPYIEALAERAEARIKNVPHRAIFLRLVNDNSALFSNLQPPSLCHEDLHKHNILFTWNDGHWRLAAILDFDSAWAGYHESDLARLELWDTMVGDSFWKSYGTLHCQEVGYLQRRPIYQLLWCFEYASNSREHLDHTQQLCTQLDIPPVDRFE